MIGRSQKPSRVDGKSFDRPAATPTSDTKVADDLREVMQVAPGLVQVDESAEATEVAEVAEATEVARAQAETITRINLHMKVAAVSLAELASVSRQVSVPLSDLVDALARAGAIPGPEAERLKEQAGS